MKVLSTIARVHKFEIPMLCYKDYSFDNTEALNHRFCLVIIEKGSGVVYIDGKSHIYMAPCVLCINEQEHILFPEANDKQMRIIYFHPHIINSSLDFDTIRKLPENSSITLIQDTYWNKFFTQRSPNFWGKITIGPITCKRLVTLFNSIHKQLSDQSQDNWPCRSRYFFMAILVTLDNVCVEETSLDQPLLCLVSEEFKPFLLYIYNNYDKKITVEDISKKFNVNRTTLSKMFQENLNVSFITFLNKLRVSVACQILRDTTLPIMEIMSRVGFQDSAHYLRTFKKYTNLSPSDYREKYCWML